MMTIDRMERQASTSKYVRTRTVHQSTDPKRVIQGFWEMASSDIYSGLTEVVGLNLKAPTRYTHTLQTNPIAARNLIQQPGSTSSS